MKNLLMIALSFAFSIQLAAQNPVINNFVDKYQHLENVTHVNLTGDLVNLISKVKDENGDRKFVSTLDAIRVISIEDISAVSTNDISSLIQGIQANDYEELVRVRDGKDLVQIYLQEDKDQVITDLIIMVQEPEEFTLVSLSGQLYYDDLRKIEIDGEAGEMLENLPDRGQPRP